MKYIVSIFISLWSFVTGTACAIFYLAVATVALNYSMNGPLAFDPSYVDYGVGMLTLLFGIPISLILVYLFSFAIWRRLKKSFCPAGTNPAFERDCANARSPSI
jgi:hypothetical protein